MKDATTAAFASREGQLGVCQLTDNCPNQHTPSKRGSIVMVPGSLGCVSTLDRGDKSQGQEPIRARNSHGVTSKQA